MNREERLIYNLIFSNESIFDIDISDYITDIYNYEDFVSQIKNILKKSKVKIVKSSLILDSKTVKWNLKVKK